MSENVVYYKIIPVKVPVHGLFDRGLLSEAKGFTLYKQSGIKLISMGNYASEEEAVKVARKYAAPREAKFV